MFVLYHQHYVFKKAYVVIELYFWLFPKSEWNHLTLVTPFVTSSRVASGDRNQPMYWNGLNRL